MGNLFGGNSGAKKRVSQDEKVSYVVIAKTSAAAAEARRGDYVGRVVKRPLKGKGHVTVDICTQAGELERRVFSKSALNRELLGAYGVARKLKWGDVWPTQLGVPQSRADKLDGFEQ